VTVLTTGTCTIQATQAGNTNYAAAAPVNQSFTVTPASQSVAFGLPSTTATVVYGQNGSFTTSNSSATAGGLFFPGAVAVDSSGNVYVSDTGNSRLLMYPPGSTTATRVYGRMAASPRPTAPPPLPVSVIPAVSPIDGSGNLWVADALNNRVLMYPSGSTTATLVLGQSSFTANSIGTTNNTLRSPNSVATDSSGNLWVADTNNNRVLMWQNASSLSSGAAANLVFGQSSFTTRLSATPPAPTN